MGNNIYLKEINKKNMECKSFMETMNILLIINIPKYSSLVFARYECFLYF